MRWPVIRGGLILVAVAYLVSGALSFLPDKFWMFEAISNCRAELVWLGVIIAALLLVLRLPITALVIALTAAVQFYLTLHPSDPVANVASRAPNLRVMTIDIGAGKHRDDAHLISMIVAAHPDILVLTGDMPTTRKMIATAAGSLPFHAETGTGAGGVSIDSRYVLANTQAESPDPLTPILTAQIAVPAASGHTVIFFIASHPMPPEQGWMARHRSEGLAALGKWAGAIDAPVIVAGTLNVTPQSELFGRLLRSGDLFDTARGSAPPATWLSTVPALGLRIDHVLVSPDIEVAARSVGDDFGAAHRPVIVDVVVPTAE